MHKALKGYLSGFGLNGIVASARRLIFVAALAILLPVAAGAYTVVLRSGRRVEVPMNFTVTKLTLTYETAPGINITLLMSSVDIQATERINNEPAGALLGRAAQQAIIKTKVATARQPRRELTKQDIEAARQARQRSEQEYERRRVELGLPSLEETRLRTEEETKRLSEAARQSGVEEAQAEAYWRTRSTGLRTEIAALDAQVNYVRVRLAEIPEYTGFGNYGFISGVAPAFHSRQPRVRFPIVTGNPGFMRGNSPGIQGAGFLAFGGATQAQIQLNAGLTSRGFGRRGGMRQGIIPPAGIYLNTPYPNYDYTGERTNLIYRLHELEAARVGLQARWRLLEEEARRAGALPGWLRP
ncbi:MAG: hypothetical protein H0U54_05880 [Acidobacteria bacterium]|nr:hypothetical protein [Acidobacteriota bacterium]